ncbi:MAG: hypothetical protein ABIH77_00140 [Pseudomonadota bacterium]|nr:hypothetical protein [Gammaproteobacteria bacterium]MBU1927167.1 hypothetical protein [Gammaproteobacteria bacterium]MBU2546579.1 hypothetical protein [Gammaproteobacteria bacterium]
MSKLLRSITAVSFLLFSIFGLTIKAQETCTGDVCTINTAQQKTSSSPWESNAEKHMKEWEELSKQGAKSGGDQYQYDLYPTTTESKKQDTTKEVKTTKEAETTKKVKTPVKKTEAKTDLQTYEFHAGKNVLYVTLKDGKIVNKGYAIWDAKDPSAQKIKDLMIQGISFEEIEQALGSGRLMEK